MRGCAYDWLVSGFENPSYDLARTKHTSVLKFRLCRFAVDRRVWKYMEQVSILHVYAHADLLIRYFPMTCI